MDDAMELMDGNRGQGLLAAEFMTQNCMELVRNFAQLPDPLGAPWPYYLLLETADSPQLPADSDAVIDGRLWAYRERQTDSVSSLGQVHKLDVGVPLEPAFSMCGGTSRARGTPRCLCVWTLGGRESACRDCGAVV